MRVHVYAGLALVLVTQLCLSSPCEGHALFAGCAHMYNYICRVCCQQAHGVGLGLADVGVIACTATLAAVGAAAIPSAGLVTMLMVLQAVSLERFASDLAVVLAVDWLLDRCRTVVNVLGDACGVMLIDHACLTRMQRSVNDLNEVA